jgi:Flp pilus assembly protein TadB
MSDYLPLVAAISSAIVIILGFQLVFDSFEDARLRLQRLRLLSAYSGSRSEKSAQKLRDFFTPSSSIENLGQRLISGKYQSGLQGMLINSGDWENEKYTSLLREKVLYSIFALITGLGLIVINGFSVVPVSVLLLLLAFFLPDVLLKNRIIKRKKLIADSLPDAIDMLQMCVSAGLAFPAALSRVAETQQGPVAEEFARVTAEVQLGQSRVEALRDMAERTQEPHIAKFVSSMSQVDSFGIPISNVLLEQSKQMRVVRRERARERGQKVPIKLLGPIMLCFLPSVIVIILAPAVLSIVRAFAA